MQMPIIARISISRKLNRKICQKFNKKRKIQIANKFN